MGSRSPEDTFKPNKINVLSSIIVMEKWDERDTELKNEYHVTFIDIKTLGYYGSGELIRGFDLERLLTEVEQNALDTNAGTHRSGYQWTAFDVAMTDIKTDGTYRLDLKYWLPEVLLTVDQLREMKAPSIKDVNTIDTKRGISPKAEDYVDEKDGYALVIKAGTCISKFGLVTEGSDYVEKDVFDELSGAHLQDGDVLLASTGTGTLGKAGVFNLGKPAIADSHVTIIRCDQANIDPYYLADYLRVGAGAAQIVRLYTGSTGLIELAPEDVDRILVDQSKSLEEQRQTSEQLRKSETAYRDGIILAEEALIAARNIFAQK